MPVRMTPINPVQDTWVILHQTYQSILKCADDTFAEIGIPHQQFLVLRALQEIPDMVTPSVAANWLDRNPNSITLIIDRMEKNGLVKRVRDLKDRRAIRLIITPEGHRMYKKAKKPANELPKKLFSVLSQEELALFKGLIEKVREKSFELRDITDKVIDMNKRD